MLTTDITKNVAFTGHRTGRISQPLLWLYVDMVSEIRRLYSLGYRNFLSGMAEGGDLIFAKAVTAVRQECTDMKLVAVVPFRNQSERYTTANKALYQQMLREADKTVILSESYYKGCFHRRNDYLTDYAEVMLAYWDKRPYGGTYYTIGKAQMLNRTIINLYK